ncbi:hypothetical protein JM83_0136 [Gillisia sp. Hel_I_86]|uniref:hypothetical protein n=1 Tax=Gillisia sp. Hel_I_86 TaxID=1249981 RepID=UPI00119AF96C|nr:hypothetical protein [Gillisia sp. Hel_I_86]TVZ25234.1 hypothetical protein JM83_0136 [Gillisia sp. Hel_I_86]
MELERLKKRTFSKKKNAIIKEYILLEKLVQELQNRELPPEVLVEMNVEIEHLNACLDDHPRFLSKIKSAKMLLLNNIHKNLEIVPKNYYRNLWLAIGMSAFGLPLGIVFSVIWNNYSFMAIGLPIGMSIGIALGTLLDKQAEENNRQLELEIT